MRTNWCQSLSPSECSACFPFLGFFRFTPCANVHVRSNFLAHSIPNFDLAWSGRHSAARSKAPCSAHMTRPSNRLWWKKWAHGMQNWARLANRANRRNCAVFMWWLLEFWSVALDFCMAARALSRRFQRVPVSKLENQVCTFKIIKKHENRWKSLKISKITSKNVFFAIFKVTTWLSSFETGTLSKRLLNARAAMQKSSTTDQNSRNDLHFSCAFLPKTPKLPLAHQHVTFSNFYTLRKFFHKNIKKAHADDMQRTVNVVAK